MKSAPAARSNESAQASAHSAPQQADLPGIERASEAPRMPRPKTRPAEALALLIAREHVDQRDFLDVRGGWRLAAAIHDLRALGWRIETELVPEVLANGEVTHIARYRLDRAAGSPHRHQAGFIAPELAAWLALAVVTFLLPLSGRWFA